MVHTIWKTWKIFKIVKHEIDEVWRTFLEVFVRYINNIMCCVIGRIETIILKRRFKLSCDARRRGKRDIIIAHESLTDVGKCCVMSSTTRNGHDACTSIYGYVSNSWGWFSQVGWKISIASTALLLWQQQNFKESRKNRYLEIVFGSKCGFVGYAVQQSLYK